MVIKRHRGDRGANLRRLWSGAVSALGRAPAVVPRQGPGRGRGDGGERARKLDGSETIVSPRDVMNTARSLITTVIAIGTTMSEF